MWAKCLAWRVNINCMKAKRHYYSVIFVCPHTVVLCVCVCVWLNQNSSHMVLHEWQQLGNLKQSPGTSCGQTPPFVRVWSHGMIARTSPMSSPHLYDQRWWACPLFAAAPKKLSLYLKLLCGYVCAGWHVVFRLSPSPSQPSVCSSRTERETNLTYATLHAFSPL